MPMPTIAARNGEYARFPNVPARNGLQASVEIPLLLAALRLPCGGRLLEVGCGRGVALPVLAARLAPAEVVGVDVDAEALAEAEAYVDACAMDATLMKADVRRLPFDAGRFDLVIDFGTCYHVSGGGAGRRAALAEVARVLAPDGLFVHETRVAQRLAHPVRSFGRRLPWDEVPELVPERGAVLWAVRRRLRDA